MRIFAASILIALSIAVGACADDPSFNNREACEDYVNAVNELECVSGATTIDAEQACGAYTDSTVDCSEIFDCYVSNMMCMDVGGGVSVINNFTEGCPTQCK